MVIPLPPCYDVAMRSRGVDDDIRLRDVFDVQARNYNKVRPTYPEALFEGLLSKAQLADNAYILEIGPGTGQATLPFARRGYKITAIELGEQLTKVAREELVDYKNVEILTGAFEDTEFPEQAFDLIYSATAFHWIEHKVRYSKPHRLLKSNGHLAIIATNHVSDEQGDNFFRASQPIYDKYTPKFDPDFNLPLTKDIKPIGDLDTKLFKLVYFECFPLVVEYSAEQFAKLLGTYSFHLALPEQTREAFLGAIEQLINDEFGGKVVKHYAMSLTLAQKI